MHNETTLHVLRDCGLLRRCWDMLDVGKVDPQFSSRELEEWLEWNLCSSTKRHWHAPPLGWIKVNNMVLQEVIRVWLVLLVLFRIVLVIGSLGLVKELVGVVSRTELWTLRLGLLAAWDKDHINVIDESDSQLVLSLVTKESPAFNAHQPLIQDIQSYVSRNWEVSLVHVYQEENRMADKLANIILDSKEDHFDWSQAPLEVQDMIASDNARVA
ncbi:Ribonuclease H protein [Quillaja saponaria]|uniref:Ribonuclease H protein n=1 Tax=Quillaja saponaria TaxID=32244 RepID=A0AAD7PP28_QUISA|nr:Ribonuclease H protein [Quillaja saponaria]